MRRAVRPSEMRWLEYHGPDGGEPAVFSTAIIDLRHLPENGYVVAVNESDRDWDVYVQTAPGATHGEPLATIPPKTSKRVWGRI